MKGQGESLTLGWGLDKARVALPPWMLPREGRAASMEVPERNKAGRVELRESPPVVREGYKQAVQRENRVDPGEA